MSGAESPIAPASAIDEVVVCCGTLRVSVTSDCPLPEHFRRFAAGLQELVTPHVGQHGGKLEFRVSSELDDDELRLLVARKAVKPTAGVLARLPESRFATMHVDRDSGKPVLVWSRAGVLVGAANGPGAAIYTARRTDNLAWMLAYLVATACVRGGCCGVLHGSVMHLEGENVALFGASESGKTSLTMLCLANGAQLLTEDITYVGADGRFLALPLREFLNIRTPTYRALRSQLDARVRDRIDPLFAAVEDGDESTPAQVPVPLSYFLGEGVRRRSATDRLDLLAAVSLRDRVGVMVSPLTGEEVAGLVQSSVMSAMIEWIDELTGGTRLGSGPSSGGFVAGVRAARLDLGFDYPERFADLRQALRATPRAFPAER